VKTDNIKDEVTQDMEKSQKKRTKQKCKTKRRPIQKTRTAEDRISELEDEMIVKGKIKELLVKQLKTCGKKFKNSLPTSKDQT
jgi:hypothetical protein